MARLSKFNCNARYFSEKRCHFLSRALEIFFFKKPKIFHQSFLFFELLEILRTPVNSHLANRFPGNPSPKDIKMHPLANFHIDRIRFGLATVKNVVVIYSLNFFDAIPDP